MGIKFLCPNGHKLHVKSFLASQRGVCPQCGEKFLVPAQSLPDIRVESLGVKESARVSSAAGGAATKSSKTAKPAKPVKPADVAVPQEPFSSDESDDRQELTEVADVQAAAEEITPVTDPAEVRGSDSAKSPASMTAVKAAAENDAIAQAPTAQWYVRIATGEQFGPALGDLMQSWLNEGRVAADSLVWREGWAEWAVAGNVFRQLAQAPVSPAVVPGSIDAFEQGLAEQVESLVLPAPAIDPVPTVELSIKGRTKTTPALDSRRPNKNYHRLILTLMVLAVLCLFPLLIYVLWR